ncbi:MAG: nitroreductase family deazaflavin-dependent oxidoreductase [Gammaproteobacteria bacterium]|nr:MAG: nitroreductase family deazaflavin-dependent oxidoreductase [Gammaproteobacteria bacterium]RLA52254.1 MAG: nitroreductase family deazaflavin-dependent oxidoreductase [Gammaproteobacteria bacterium]
MINLKTATSEEMAKILPYLKVFSSLNEKVYRWTGGRVLGKLNGHDVCLVTMTGAKSGKKRVIPLMHVPYKDGVIIVASQGGAPKNPVWFNNLVAHPDIEVQYKNNKMKLRARRADSEEKQTVWPVCCEHYPDYDIYQKRTGRDIPVFICEPV